MRDSGYKTGDMRNSKYQARPLSFANDYLLAYYYGDKTKENKRHGRDEIWLIILVGELERPMLVAEGNNKHVLKKEV